MKLIPKVKLFAQKRVPDIFLTRDKLRHLGKDIEGGCPFYIREKKLLIVSLTILI